MLLPHTRQFRLDAMPNLWRYGGAWDIDDPYLPIIGLQEGLINKLKQDQKQVIPKKQINKFHMWIYVVCVLIGLFLIYKVSH